MFLEKISVEKKNAVNLKIMGDDLTSRVMVVFSSVCDGKCDIRNASLNKNLFNLVNIIRKFGISVEVIENENILSVVGKGLHGYKQAENIINVNSSLENLLLLAIVVANQDFKTFITADDEFIKNDFSCLHNYLENINLVFNSNSNLPLLCYGKKNFLTKSTFKTDDVFDKNLLLLSSIYSRRNISILDENLKEEFIENLFSHFGVDIVEKYFDNTNYLTRNISKCKEILICKTKDFKLDGKNFEIHVNIKEVVYSIFLFMFLDIDEIVINNVAFNELNDVIIKILIENGINIQFKNQKIMNKIKVSDLIIKRSILKPISISKERTKKILDYYPFIILLNVLKNNSFNIYSIKYIKDLDRDNYDFLINTLKSFGFAIDENRENLEFLSHDNAEIILDKQNFISSEGKIDNKIYLAFLLSSITMKNSKIDFDLDSILNIFPNLFNVLEQFEVKYND